MNVSVAAAPLLWAMLFGTVGIGYFVYGRKRGAVVPLICGVALMVYPYFVANVVLLIFIGIVLMAVPYFISV